MHGARLIDDVDVLVQIQQTVCRTCRQAKRYSKQSKETRALVCRRDQVYGQLETMAREVPFYAVAAPVECDISWTLLSAHIQAIP